MSELSKITADISQYVHRARIDERRKVVAQLREMGHADAADLIDPDNPDRPLEEWECALLSRM